VTWATVPNDRFAFTRGTPVTYASSAHGRRTRCATCGSPLTFHTTTRPDDVDITAGTFDHPERCLPETHIWVSSRIAWLDMGADLPAHEEGSPA